jgi:uncharacterized phage protein (TIGR01671 family)
MRLGNNMKELKFRVWNTVKNCFVTEKIPFADGVAYTSYPYYLGLDGKLNFCNYQHMALETDKCIIQQYTGIKDLNQREIFEGDIMCDNEGVRYEVRFEGGAFVKFAYGKNTSNLIDSIRFLQAEIVGNVFENPDPLLGQ